MSVREFVPSDDGSGLRIVVIAAQWNEPIVKQLLYGALATLASRGVAPGDVAVVWVPGSFELPTGAKWAATTTFVFGDGGMRKPHAVVALGCVIRGETEHFRLVADAASQGLAGVATETGVPVLNGVLAVEDLAQAEARAGGGHGNTGSQVALAAIRMANLLRERWTS